MSGGNEMIYCVTQPLTSYGFVSEDGPVGIYYTYPDPLLFNLITRCSRVPFMYEQGSKVPMLERLGAINGIEAFEKTLKNKDIKTMLELMDPLEFSTVVCGLNLEHLSLSKYWQGQDSLKFIIQARAYQWSRYCSEGKIHRLAPRKLDETQEAIVAAANIYKN
jgi:hypothetical protein